jgi:hypothetical protein
LENEIYDFPYFIIPTDSYFSEGVETTNQSFLLETTTLFHLKQVPPASPGLVATCLRGNPELYATHRSLSTSTGIGGEFCTAWVVFDDGSPWLEVTKKGKNMGKRIWKMMENEESRLVSWVGWFETRVYPQNRIFRGNMMENDDKPLDYRYHMFRQTTWRFLKMGDPQVTMGFNTKMVKYWMTWGYWYLRFFGNW